MSAIIARTAARTALRSSFQTVPQRNFSLASSLRNLTKGMEAHPHGRVPVSQASQPGDYGKYVKRAGKVFVIYAPLATVILGWPLGVRWAMEDRM